MATLTPDTLVADSGTVLSFSGGTFDIADLGDEDGNTGLTIGSNNAFIDFSMSNPTFSNIDTATFNVTVTTNGVNNKNVILIQALDDNSGIGVISAVDGTGTFSFDITSLGIARITNTNFRIQAVQAITNISEVSITLTNSAKGGKVIINGRSHLKAGKLTL